MRYKRTDDMVLFREIIDKLAKNKRIYGARYCPCVPSYKYATDNCEDYICPCKEFRENAKVGETCHCGLFTKEEDEDEETV